MRKVFHVLIIIGVLISGCNGMRCDQLVAGNLTQDENMLGFSVYRTDGSYWGEFAIYSVDQSISHSNNSGQKFRIDLNDLDVVEFWDKRKGTGCLTIRWKDQRGGLSVARLPEPVWEQMMDFVAGWPEASKFKERVE